MGAFFHSHIRDHGHRAVDLRWGGDLTGFGQAVLAVMILAGGLGLMAITTFLQGFVVQGLACDVAWTAARLWMSSEWAASAEPSVASPSRLQS